MVTSDVVLQLDNVNIWCISGKNAMTNVSVEIHDHKAIAITGSSGCGKNTLLRVIDRMYEFYPGIHTDGCILLQGESILEKDPMVVHRMAGMVLQQSNPFPTMNIVDNVTVGYKLNDIKISEAQREEIPTSSLQSVGLWEEVKDKLDKHGSFLSDGQQQRLCVARTLALRPRLLPMDEPISVLDPVTTNHIEELILELRGEIVILTVTHNMGQVVRISDCSVSMHSDELVKHDRIDKMFTSLSDQCTEGYLQGNFG